MAYLDECYSCYIAKKESYFSENQKTSSKMGALNKETSPATSTYTTLENKLESKIGQ